MFSTNKFALLQMNADVMPQDHIYAHDKDNDTEAADTFCKIINPKYLSADLLT